MGAVHPNDASLGVPLCLRMHVSGMDFLLSATELPKECGVFQLAVKSVSCRAQFILHYMIELFSPPRGNLIVINRSYNFNLTISPNTRSAT